MFYCKKDYLKDELWQDNFRHLANRKLSFDIQIYPHQFDDACKLAKRYPNVQFILNHTGEPCFQTEEYKKYWMRNFSYFQNLIGNFSYKNRGKKH